MGTTISQIELEKNLYSVNIPFKNIQIDDEEIQHILGYREATPVHFVELIKCAIQGLPARSDIKAGYCLASFKKSSTDYDRFYADNTLFTADKIVTGTLKKSTQIALFICSIGPAMEQWVAELNAAGDLAFSYIVNTVASSAVESAANALHDHIGCVMQAKGVRITNRYSPGYCNWPVSEQHKLFSFFPKDFCGVTLTESALMMPIKSVSGIIGIGKNVKYREYTCDNCVLTDCTYRAIRIGRTVHEIV